LHFFQARLLSALFSMLISAAIACSGIVMPATSPTGVANRVWSWRGFQTRYQCLGDEHENAPAVILVHGLFVNADHWRRNLPALAEAGFRAYSIDLLGYGYSDKPYPTSDEATAISGEKGRALGMPEQVIGSASGDVLPARPVQQAHPVEGSVYNFYTWAEQLADFKREVIGSSAGTVLVANSIGSISALQAAIDDEAELFDGVFIVNPNFRELHSAEQPGWVRPLAVPVIGAVQQALRRYGQPLFDALAKPGTVKQILMEPYTDPNQVTDELVEVLLTPLLAEGAADVVFDTLSYSAGPLPEPLLSDSRLTVPVQVCFGEDDPWTPAPRVRALERFATVQSVTGLPGVGHCPHDEAPDRVNPMIVDFVRAVCSAK